MTVIKYQSQFELKKAFSEIYDKYYSKIYRYIYSCLLKQEDAEDITSEVFFAFLDSFFNKKENIEHPSAFLLKIARNRVINFRNKAINRHEEAAEELPEDCKEDNYFTKEERSLKNPENQRMFNIIKHLSFEEREFLELRYAFDLKNPEIASILNINEKAVSARYARLLDKCRRIDQESSNVNYAEA